MKKTIKIKSSNNVDELYGVMYVPDEAPKAILTIVHGLGDRIDNYDEIGNIFNNNGILVAGIDMIGFGKTVIDLNNLGNFTDKKNTINYFVEDLRLLREELDKEYKDIPNYILGYSFGSFITRMYINKYSNDLKGALLLGTTYKSPFAMSIAKFITRYLAVGKTWNDRNIYLFKKTIGALNDNFEDKTIPSWLNSDISKIRRMKDDPYANTRLTLNGYYVLYDLIGKCNTKKNMKGINKELPIYLMSGKDDPVGDFGADIYKLNRMYLGLKLNKTKFKIYNNMRHDILNEVNRDVVINDILKFIDDNK